MFELVFFLAILLLAFVTGSTIERQHFRRLDRQEAELRSLPMLNVGAKAELPEARESQLFSGSVVVAADPFKALVGGIYSIFGGRVRTHETLLERGRREALVRLKTEARNWGATRLLNVRLETATLGEGGNGANAIEVMAYGTAVR